MSLGERINGHVSGYYVDPDGIVKSTISTSLPSGLRYEFRKMPYGIDVNIVVDGRQDEGGRINFEGVLWNSLEKMSDAGIDVSRFKQPERR